MSRSAVAVALALGLSSWRVHVALAEPSPEPRESAEAAPSTVRLTYTADPGCPGRDDFVTRVKARTRTRSLRTEEGAAITGLEVTVREEAGRFVAELAVDGPGGRLRHIEAPTCAEAVDGIALVAALTLDPAAATAPASVPAPAPASVALTETKKTDAGASVEPTNKKTATDESSLHLRASAGVFLANGAAPALAPEGELAISAAFADERPLGFVGWAGARFTVPVTHSFEEGRATFESWAIYGAACPAVRATSSLSFSLCGAIEGGQILAKGSDTTNPRSSAKPWLAVGPSLGLEWALVPNFLLGLDAESLFPLTHDWFLLGQSEVFRVPTFAPRAGIRGILGFW